MSLRIFGLLITSVASLLADRALAQDDITRVWNQFGGSPARNNVAQGKNVPIDFAPGDFDEHTGVWKKETSRHIKWVVDAQTQGWIAPVCSPVIADGKVFIGSNNYAEHGKRFPSSFGLSCLLCFNVGDVDGKLNVFRCARRKELLHAIAFGFSLYAAPVVCNNVLYVATREHLFAIASDQDSKTKE